MLAYLNLALVLFLLCEYLLLVLLLNQLKKMQPTALYSVKQKILIINFQFRPQWNKNTTENNKVYLETTIIYMS